MQVREITGKKKKEGDFICNNCVAWKSRFHRCPFDSASTFNIVDRDFEALVEGPEFKYFAWLGDVEFEMFVRRKIGIVNDPLKQRCVCAQFMAEFLSSMDSHWHPARVPGAPPRSQHNWAQYFEYHYHTSELFRELAESYTAEVIAQYL